MSAAVHYSRNILGMFTWLRDDGWVYVCLECSTADAPRWICIQVLMMFFNSMELWWAFFHNTTVGVFPQFKCCGKFCPDFLVVPRVVSLFVLDFYRKISIYRKNQAKKSMHGMSNVFCPPSPYSSLSGLSPSSVTSHNPTQVGLVDHDLRAVLQKDDT